ncbi:heterokaryon incompatibility protein-domain-containing protein, partial [Lasiosphaeris hirsuta]
MLRLGSCLHLRRPRQCREKKKGEVDTGRSTQPGHSHKLPQIDPEGASRWHTEWCKKPDIVVSGANIHCSACNRTPNVPAMISKPSKEGNLAPLPADELYGTLNLSWPPSVPYRKSATRATEETGLVDGDVGQRSEATNNRIYTKALTSSEIRLVRLPTAKDRSAPLHLSLEVHGDQRYPEYEATSYTWAGEEGDGSLCWPIYVGPYWDILLQTRNCLDMLTFLRPQWGGDRLVWVDAVCINQADINERAAQVAKMGLIYRQCRRVVVFLGRDVVDPSPGQCYPLRRGLEEFGTLATSPNSPSQLFNDDGKLNLRFLLKRRFFSRMWIIQELLLARQLAILVGDFEVLVDSYTSQALLQRQDNGGHGWEDTETPWLQYAAQGRFFDLNVLQLLELTAGSKCSDPRDKVFGLLGLLQSGRGAPVPDYALSAGHVLAGIAAHCVLDVQFPELLYNATGATAGGQCPSWMPAWTQLLALGDTLPVGKWCSVPSTSEVKEITAKFRRLSQVNLYPNIPHWSESNDPNVAWVNRTRPMVRDAMPWYDSGMVDASTAALTINLTHLATIPTKLEFDFEFEGIRAYQATRRVNNARPGADKFIMHILSRHPALDQLVEPLDDVFVLDRPDIPPLFLILRSGGRPAGSFGLITCCHHVFLEFHNPIIP